MAHRFGFLLGIGTGAVFAAGCSSSSPPAPVGDAADAAAMSNDGADQDADTPLEAARPAAMCDAVSLAPAVDGGAAACFECQATHCVAEVAACSIDCTCAPAYACLERMSTAGSLNSGYSLCMEARDAIMNGNVAVTAAAGCATKQCGVPCGFGDGG